MAFEGFQEIPDLFVVTFFIITLLVVIIMGNKIWKEMYRIYDVVKVYSRKLMFPLEETSSPKENSEFFEILISLMFIIPLLYGVYAFITDIPLSTMANTTFGSIVPIAIVLMALTTGSYIILTWINQRGETNG